MKTTQISKITRVVFDVDGTLTRTSHRDHFLSRNPPDWKSFNAACVDDPPNEKMCDLATMMHTMGVRVELWTGRGSRWRAVTMSWMSHHGVRYDKLRMREEWDNRHANSIKEDWFREDLEADLGPPDLAFDDRVTAVKWWRSLGVPCLDVAGHEY